MKIKSIAICLVIILAASYVFADSYNDRYEIKTDHYGSSYGNSMAIEMRKKYDYTLSSRYRGEIERDGSVRMNNYEGDRLRGNIDRNGYGTLRDQRGNMYRVRPR